jgi:hypothetical protein
LLTLELQYVENISATALRSTIRRIEKNMKEKFSDITWVFFEAQSLTEKEIKEQNLDL